MTEKAGDQQGAQFVDAPLQIAELLAQAQSPQTFGEIASKLPLGTSKVHRYLVSLCRWNIVFQNPIDGRYGIDAENAKRVWADGRTKSCNWEKHGRTSVQNPLNGPEMWRLLHEPDFADLIIK